LKKGNFKEELCASFTTLKICSKKEKVANYQKKNLSNNPITEVQITSNKELSITTQCYEVSKTYSK
jgi:hypothetical protein